MSVEVEDDSVMAIPNLVSSITSIYTWKLQIVSVFELPMRSSDFKIPNINCSWYLELDGSRKRFYDEQSFLIGVKLIFMSKVLPAEYKEISVTFSVEDNLNKKCTTTSCKVVDDETIFHCPKFFSTCIADISNISAIHCEIKLLYNVFPPMTSRIEDFEVSDPGAQIAMDLDDLLKSEKFSDLQLLSSCGMNFQVHKAILAARSTVFSAMFDCDMIDEEDNSMEIPDVDGETLEELLLFIYTGKVKNLKSVASNLLAAANKYAIKDLKVMCEKALYDDMDIDNCVEILFLADSHQANLLKRKALHFIAQHLKSVMKTSAFISDWQSYVLIRDTCNNS